MDVAAILTALNLLFAALKPLLPLVAPIIVGLLEKMLPEWLEKIPAVYKPILSAAIGVLIAYLSGLATDGTDAVALMTGAGLGFGGAKMRDIAVGKPDAHSEMEA